MPFRPPSLRVTRVDICTHLACEVRVHCLGEIFLSLFPLLYARVTAFQIAGFRRNKTEVFGLASVGASAKKI